MPEFKPFDLLRMGLGDVPWSFLLEAVLRITIIYAILLISMRLMGKRMGSQLNRTEMTGLVSLAAAGGVPILAPDRGIVAPLVASVIIVLGQRLLARATFSSSKFEHIAQDDLSILVEDGCLQLDAMKECLLSQERVFAKLRGSKLDSLGQVKRLYMEANGSFTVIEQDEPQPGLTLAPDWDQDYIQQQQQRVPDMFACTCCGNLASSSHMPTTQCPRCNNTKWSPAVTKASSKQQTSQQVTPELAMVPD
ncbi:DUF421 domain-containing protein [Hymenobacter tibetensis]|uniref:DUF421 domain-containing protein n=1 Tax=Hymenobacter tibetensis TaxID=497967 RepID=A0ABY4CTY3_9BACT|nr:YetF domain-containing protein [Hymenobacter tibetensis]UOG73648.1 DUF421 domain-containing protein [Hymenobacter tibetensis]